MIDPKTLKQGDVVMLNGRLAEVVTIDDAGTAVVAATMIETASYAADWFAEIASPVTAEQLRRVRLLPRPDDGIRGFTHEEAVVAVHGSDGSVQWAHDHASRRPAFRMSHADAIRNEGRVRDRYTGRDDLEAIARKHAAEDVAVATAGILERVAATLGVPVQALAEDPSLAVRDRDAARAALAKVAEIVVDMRDNPDEAESAVAWWTREIDEAIRAVPPVLRNEGGQ